MPEKKTSKRRPKNGPPKPKAQRRKARDTDVERPDSAYDLRDRAKSLYLSDPDLSISAISKKLGVLYGTVHGWSVRYNWGPERAKIKEEIAEASREALIGAAREFVGNGFLRMLEKSQELREKLIDRALADLLAEERDELQPQEQEASSIEVVKTEGGKDKKVHLRTKKVRRRPNERLALAVLETEKTYTKILLGLVERGGSFGETGTSGQDAEKTVRKLQLIVSSIDELEDPGDDWKTKVKTKTEKDSGSEAGQETGDD